MKPIHTYVVDVYLKSSYICSVKWKETCYVFIFRNGFKKYVSIVEKKSLIEFIY